MNKMPVAWKEKCRGVKAKERNQANCCELRLKEKMKIWGSRRVAVKRARTWDQRELFPSLGRETWVPTLGEEDPLEKEMAPHSSTLAWKIPWTEEPGSLESMGSQRVGHN